MNYDLLALRLMARHEMISWPWSRIEMWINDRLAEVMDYAWHEIPFYQRRWQSAGLSAADYQNRHSLLDYPLTGKADLATAGGDWIRFERGGAGLCTKGTTGSPLVLWFDREGIDLGIPAVIQGFQRSGMQPGMKVLLLSPAWHRMSTAEDIAARYIGAQPVFAGGSILDSDYPRVFMGMLARHQPGYVVAMTPLVLSLIHLLEQQGADPRALFRSVRTLMVLGMPLTPGMRAYIHQRTGVPEIWDRGGSTEGLAMDECECHDHQHITEESVYCEVLQEDGRAVADGARGRLVFTRMTLGPAPVIRYDSGDIASFAANPCACGNSMRRLQLYGRHENGIRHCDGRIIMPWDVRLLMEADPDLCGRNMLLVRDSQAERLTALHLVIEGEACNETALLERLHASLDPLDIRVSWAGRVALQWNFRQVVDPEELPFLEESISRESV